MNQPDRRPGNIPVSDEPINISLKGEMLRKTTHIGALAIPIIYYVTNIKIIVALLIGALSISLFTDLIRLYGSLRSRSLIQKFFGIMIRPHEKKNFTGATYILASSVITILIFDKMVAILAITYIVVGDTAGAIVGRLWGKIKFRGKTLEGSASFFLSCCLIAFIVPGVDLWIKISGAMVAAIVEALTVYIDDNVTVPLITGVVMQLLVQ
ncbi:MAG: diacylglycerol/polyprenol kinase family protein [candidate division Zixibacteria bacterium]